MASWTFLDEYGQRYPALRSSILSRLTFADHRLTGTQFTGTLDTTPPGAVLKTIARFLNMTSIAVQGTVTESGGKLTVTLSSTDAAGFVAAVGQRIPLIARAAQSASLEIATTVAMTDSADTGPSADSINLRVTLRIGSRTVDVVAQVPMSDGFFTITGEFTGVGVQLSDLAFLMGSLATGNQWFPTQQLGPFAQGSPTFQLLSLSLRIYVRTSPDVSVSVNSLSVNVGITGIALFRQALYLNPMGIEVTVLSPTSSPTVSWGISGAMVLCNYNRPGNVANPDFTFHFDMRPSDFSITGELENASSLPVNTMIQDLIGTGTSIGLPGSLTINQFDFQTTADKSTGKISQFSTNIAMSGGFGLLTHFDLEEISVSVEHSA